MSSTIDALASLLPAPLSSSPTLVGTALALLTLLLLWRLLRPSSSALPLPPGPPGLPIVGNLFDMPKSYDWLHYAALNKQYGPINSLRALGQTIIILNTSRVISDLMDKRQAIYSDRPQMRFSGELVGWNATLGATDCGESFRGQRRAMHRVMGSQDLVRRFWEVVDVEAKRFVRRAVGDVRNWEHHVRM